MFERSAEGDPLDILVLADDEGLFRLLGLAMPIVDSVVEDAATLAEATERAIGRAHDAVVIDAGLADDWAMIAVHRLRALRPGLAIVVAGSRISRMADGAERASYLRAGADDVISMRIAAPEFAARLGAIVSRYRARRRAPLVIGGLAIDRARRTAALDGKRLGLTPWELRLLALLMAWPGRIISRPAIEAWLYGARHDIGSNVIDVFVSKIRRKLAAASCNAPEIENVSGFGFRLNAGAAE